VDDLVAEGGFFSIGHLSGRSAGLGARPHLLPAGHVPAKDASWSAAVFLDDGVEPSAILEFYRQRFSEPVRFKSWESQMPGLRQLIELEAISMVVVIFLVFGVVAIGIACSFVIFYHVENFHLLPLAGFYRRFLRLHHH
jgi:hypothetical protein